MQKEANSRIKINKLLEKSLWRFLDNGEKKANISLEAGVKIEHLGDDFENITNGFVDYLLLDDRGFPLCVLEAKKEAIHPLSAKEQAREYALSQNVRFIILSNGNAHYFWDMQKWNPEIITEFPTLESLEHRKTYNPNTQDLINILIDENYLAPIKTLRYYQVDAIKSLQKSAEKWNTRFLFEMATGTGKTTTSWAICKLFLQSGNAKRVLFLVDRIELENQAIDAFREIFKNQYFVDSIKSNDWQKCQIVVSTIQTLMAGDRYKTLFSPTDFELVISDEAHRSIGGNSRAVFEYFIGYKLWLTATPKDYLKWLNEEKSFEKNPKAIEIRNLRDTYKTFGCETGMPTFRYDLSLWVQDKFLINPYVIDARTDITTELLSETWYHFEWEDEEWNEVEEQYGIKNFEKTFFNEKTNEVFARTILENGLLDPISGEFWKMLIFCVSVNHAAKITNLLNEWAMKKWPGKYQSDFALQITSTIAKAQDFTKDFTYNRLNGKSQFAQDTHPDYTTSKTRVCVTVGMMTTGYDCPDLLGVVLLRPVFSPADFVQMKGRGTRKHTFKYVESGEKKEKEQFVLLDFFWNCEYFEKDFDYHKKLDLPQIWKDKKPIIIIDPPSSPEGIDIEEDDKIRTETILHIGNEWMKIDRELYRKEKHEQFEYVLQNSKTIQDAYKNNGIDGVEAVIKTEIFHKPMEFWDTEKIMNSYEKINKTRRRIWLTEMISKAFWFITHFETREEKFESEWQKFITTERPNIESIEKLNLLKSLFETYVTDNTFREIINNWKFAELSSYPFISMSDIKLVWLENIYAMQNYSNEHGKNILKEFSLVK